MLVVRLFNDTLRCFNIFCPALQLTLTEPYSTTRHILRNIVGHDFRLDSNQLQLPVHVRILRRKNSALLGTQVNETDDPKKPDCSQAKKLAYCHNLQLNTRLYHLPYRYAESSSTYFIRHTNFLRSRCVCLVGI